MFIEVGIERIGNTIRCLGCCRIPILRGNIWSGERLVFRGVGWKRFAGLGVGEVGAGLSIA